MTRRLPLIAPLSLALGFQLFSGCAPTSTPMVEANHFVTSHALAGGDIIAKSPQAYCVDTSTRATQNFVMMVNCDVLTVQAQTRPKARGILTVSTSHSHKKSHQTSDFKSYLGDGSTVSRQVPGLVVRKVNDQENSRLPGAAPQHWRGLMQVNNRIVSFAVYGPEGGTVLGSSGKRLLESLAKSTVNATRTNTPPEEG